MKCALPIVEVVEATEAEDIIKFPNSILSAFQTDMFLSDRPQFTQENMVGGSDGFHSAQMSLYRIYSDGSVS
jgi:hypothetical protein